MKLLEIAALDMTHAVLLLPLMRRLKEEGYEVHAASRRGPFVERIEAEGVLFHPLPMTRGLNPFGLLRALVSTLALLRRQRIDILHVHTPVAALVGRVAGRIAGVDLVIYTAHGFYHHDRMNSFKRGVFMWVEKALGRWATDLLFVQSEEDYEWARKAIGGRVVHIGNGVELSRSTGAATTKPLEERPLFLSVGRLVREKGFADLVRAVSLLEQPVDLLIAGEGPERQRLAALAARLGVRLNLPGWRDDVPALLRGSALFVLPSHREGMPRSVIEAMAAARAVVATDIRGCRELVVDGKTGLLVPVGEPQMLAKALARLLWDAGLRAEMGRAGRRRAEELYDEERVTGLQIDALAETLRQGEGLSPV